MDLARCRLMSGFLPPVNDMKGDGGPPLPPPPFPLLVKSLSFFGCCDEGATNECPEEAVCDDSQEALIDGDGDGEDEDSLNAVADGGNCGEEEHTTTGDLA